MESVLLLRSGQLRAPGKQSSLFVIFLNTPCYLLIPRNFHGFRSDCIALVVHTSHPKCSGSFHFGGNDKSGYYFSADSESYEKSLRAVVSLRGNADVITFEPNHWCSGGVNINRYVIAGLGARRPECSPIMQVRYASPSGQYLDLDFVIWRRLGETRLKVTVETRRSKALGIRGPDDPNTFETYRTLRNSDPTASGMRRDRAEWNQSPVDTMPLRSDLVVASAADNLEGKTNLDRAYLASPLEEVRNKIFLDYCQGRRSNSWERCHHQESTTQGDQRSPRSQTDGHPQTCSHRRAMGFAPRSNGKRSMILEDLPLDSSKPSSEETKESEGEKDLPRQTTIGIIPTVQETIIPKKFNVPIIAQIDGIPDPVEHVRNYTTSILGRNATNEIKCLPFLATLGGIASTWFHLLSLGSIQSFKQLKEAFLERFVGAKKVRKSKRDIQP
ncbi:hypothetical protein CRG98_032045 [Punica granatum]|uniref:Retrotransposon gag domain-containing protein n=1 Tax=Punica granatum TaxID=22663 RepID=A0A2I0IU85_PUNGR|nr:hypothetical protein CRG98_032045 [Punica granatum]